MNVAIVGAGIAGLALAKGLRTLGWTVQVYEQANALKPVGAGISLTTNALRALMALGLYDVVVEAGLAIGRLSVLDQNGHTLTDTDHSRMTERYGHVSALILHRADLHRALLSQIPASIVFTGSRCTNVRNLGSAVELTFADGETRSADLVFGCDGLHSVLRGTLFPDAAEHFARYTCWRGMAAGGAEGMRRGDVTESWGRGRRFGLAPLKNGQVYWFACMHAKRPRAPELARLRLQELRALFSDFHAPVAEVLRRTPDDGLIWNDIFDVEPLDSFVSGRVALLGDAAHAVTPDLGQGACQALEDVAIISALLSKHAFGRAFQEYNNLRLARTRSITLKSRRFAFIAQRRSVAGARLRNLAIKILPRKILERQMDKLLDVHFEPVRSDHRDQAWWESRSAPVSQ